MNKRASIVVFFHRKIAGCLDKGSGLFRLEYPDI